MKTSVYIDGYNLFYGCLKHSDDKWLDLYQLFANKIVKQQTPQAEVTTLYFFTADVKSKISTRGLEAQQPNKVTIVHCYSVILKIFK